MEKKDNWHLSDINEILDDLRTSREGLKRNKVEELQEKYGLNEIPKTSGRSWLQILLQQIKSPLIYVLIVAAGVSFWVEHYLDFWVIVVVIILNTIIGLIQEYKAERSIEALQEMIVLRTRVVRDGELKDIPATELVPGDIISLEGGDHVPADARVIEASNCRAIESSLTGESTASEKTSETLSGDVALADRKNMVWNGTHLSGGGLKAVVVATGKETILGKIAASLEQGTELKEGHFEKKTSKLAKKMGALAGFSFVAIFILGYFRYGYDFEEIFMFSLASLVSGIPEGLPAILTIVLAAGARRMAGRSVIIKHLPAIETIGGIDMIVTDKTGTLTRNTMTVSKVCLAKEKELGVTGEGWDPEGEFSVVEGGSDAINDPDLDKLLHIGAWGTAAHLVKPEESKKKQEFDIIGEPTEAALVVLAAKGGVEKEAGTSPEKKLEDIPFNQQVHYRGSLIKIPDKEVPEMYIVGAPYKLISLSNHILEDGEKRELTDEKREKLKERVESMSSEALRVIGLAYRETSPETERFPVDGVKDLVLVGLAGMKDPVRPGVKDAIKKAGGAGISVKMCTGDHKKTAMAIAKEAGLAKNEEEVVGFDQNELEEMDQEEFAKAVKEALVFARVSPNMKQKIAAELQDQGHLIAMTGDGVNDVPALKQADVGISMGIAGTDLARESSDIVLTDDNFVSIINAVEEGRNIFRNVRNASGYLITGNLAEIFIILSILTVTFTLPLRPTQILWINLITEGIPGAPLALEPGRSRVMKRGPYSRKESIISRRVIGFVVFNALIITALALAVFFFFQDYSQVKAQTAVFTVLSFSLLFNVFNMRSLSGSLFSIGLTTNRYVLYGVLVSILAQFTILFVPLFRDWFYLEALAIKEVLILAGLSVLVLFFGEIYKWLRYHN
ncbi:MAG: cation-translocating P-type ATPase [Candidatus Paceibacterota bacterium]